MQEQITVDPSDQSEANTEYSIIYLLHGDADYLYHNAEGEALQADEEVLKKAQAVAKDASRGEVFIFHQRPERKILWLFPKKDRRMYHYRNGELVNKISYSPEDARTFAAESKLYKIYSLPTGSEKPLRRVLSFYGHEIPRESQTGYHQSRPDVYFGTHPFTDGVAQFNLSDSSRFDLIVLSTCNNGTPDMVNRLKNMADYVLASPHNLHLSHIDSDSLSVLERDPSISTADLAGKMADQTFDRLSKSIQTEITLALYNMDEVKNYVSVLAQRLARQMSEKEQRLATDNIDCTRLLPDEMPGSTGVNVWFKPPAFGKKSTDESHSGWGCMGLDR